MISILNNNKKWIIILYYICLICFSTYVLLDTFVIPKTIEILPSMTEDSSMNLISQDNSLARSDQIDSKATVSIETDPIITVNSYEDENISISIDTVRKYDSTLYIADIVISDPSYLKTAFADNTYGRNIKDITSEIAQENQAIFAINGDFYGFRDQGFVLRNGILYQNTVRDSDSEALLIDSKGDLSILTESTTNLENIDEIPWQVMSFGPSLMSNGLITIDNDSDLDKLSSSNPRTAIGQISSLHYIIIVTDGRTDESSGLTLYELAETFDQLGCVIAYNLDGGGSSTMYFNGEIVNIPTSGKKIEERAVSDIVYFGYE